MNYARNILELIGATPVLRYPLPDSYTAQLFLKLERFNPTDSMKDRSAFNMIEDAEKTGKLLPGGTIIEASSGNTATSLAMIAAVKGYRFIAVTDDKCSHEEVAMIEAYGGSVVRVKHATEGASAVNNRRQIARQLALDTPLGFYAGQADNPANPEGYRTLANELLEQVPDFDTLIGALSTGGSLCGTARSIRENGKTLHVIGVEPEGSTFYTKSGHAYYQAGTGLPPGTRPPQNFDRDQINEPVQVPDAAAFTTCKFLARRHGILVGGSSGGLVLTALGFLAENQQRSAVVILPDAGEKYLSTVYSKEWIQERGLHDQEVWDYLSSLYADNAAHTALHTE